MVFPVDKMTITIGIAGITGKFARELSLVLLQHADINIKGFCRDPSKLPASFSSNSQLTLIKGDGFDVSALRSFVDSCEVVVCCYLGPENLMVDGQKLLIDACEEAGVSRYVASDWCLDYTKLDFGQLFPKDPMKHIKAYLESKEKIKGVHILVGAFIEPFFSPPFGIFDPASVSFRYWGTGDEIWEGTTYANAAEYTAAVCLDKNAIGIQRRGSQMLRDCFQEDDILTCYSCG